MCARNHQRLQSAKHPVIEEDDLFRSVVTAQQVMKRSKDRRRPQWFCLASFFFLLDAPYHFSLASSATHTHTSPDPD